MGHSSRDSSTSRSQSHSYSARCLKLSRVARENEDSFAVGAAAGKRTQTDKIRLAGGMDIPLIRKLLRGYKYGAEYVNGGMKVS
jgi:basic membrane lipoprotein Med (substrate-binding protein (PBP1-ABC) superfamily)